MKNFDRSGNKAIVVAQHYNGVNGVLVEGDSPTVLEDPQGGDELASALRAALAASSVKPLVGLGSRTSADWHAFRVSGARSVSAFEDGFIQVLVSGANEMNTIYKLEGFPEPNAELRVSSTISAASKELGDRCLSVWRACRDRAV